MHEPEFTHISEIHVWHVALGTREAPAALEPLSETERDRAGRFRFEKHRRRWVNSREALRHILSRYTRTSPSALRFVEGRFGKPALAGQSARQALHFNLAHSADLAVVAVTRCGPVGVDVERVVEKTNALELAAHFFCPEERDDLRSLPATLRNEAFFSCWTRKEAFIKAVGSGLSLPLNAFRVTLVPDAAAQLVSIRGSSGEAAKWRLLSFKPTDQYVAAVAVNTPPPCQLRHFAFDWPRA